MEPPTKRAITFHASWPPVAVEELPETRSDHARMVLLMAATTLLVVGSSVPDAVAVFPAFIAGDAFNNWVDFPNRFGDDEEVTAE